MTVRNWAGADAAAPSAARPEAAAESLSACKRHNYRARFWRVAIGALGLFWVCVILLLVR